MTKGRLLLGLSVVTLFGCAQGGGAASARPPTPCATGTVVDTAAKLVSPASGATGVSPAVGAITFAYGNAEIPYAQITLTPNDGSNPVGTMPTTYATPPPAAGMLTLSIPTLKASTSYTVTAMTTNFAHIVGCYVEVTAALGAFTTKKGGSPAGGSPRCPNQSTDMAEVANWGGRIGALVDPDGSLVRLIQD